MNTCNIKQTTTQHGAALIMALIVMLVLSVVVIGYSTDVDLDIKISRNLQLKNQAFNWAEAGIDISEEIVALSVDTRGDLPDTSQGASTPIVINSIYQATAVTFDEVETGSELEEEDWDYYPLYLTKDGLIYLCEIADSSNHVRKADVQVTYRGSRPGDGGSIIIAAGYEGVGKGAGAAGGFQSFYQIESQGYEKHNSCQTVGAVYRHVLR